MSTVLHLYDTRERSVVQISPADGNCYTLYACGPTVYRDAHVGNLRTFMLADLIARAVTLDGYSIRIVQNITDVGHMIDDRGLGDADEGQGNTEDKLLAESENQNRSALDIARHYENQFKHDLALLNCRPADVYPRASEWIDSMVEVISTLIDRGHAYVGGDGSVFFDAQSCSDYGAISGNKLAELKPGHRFDGGVDENKRFHADWALWKIAPETRTQLVWQTPWGVGFPGWHIECSAMSVANFGSSIDIHTGGIDLRFPHHEDERAQSNAFAGTDVVRHWVHAEHLLFEGRKMSKSTGNVVLLSDVTARGFDPLSLRLAFLSTRYRTQIDLNWDSIAAANGHISRWREKIAETLSEPCAVSTDISEFQEKFMAAILDDLDTPRAVNVVRDCEKNSDVQTFAAFALWADGFLGLDLDRAPEKIEIPAEVLALVELRENARSNKEWQRSDELRNQIAELGWNVKDTKSGPEITQLTK